MATTYNFIIILIEISKNFLKEEEIILPEFFVNFHHVLCGQNVQRPMLVNVTMLVNCIFNRFRENQKSIFSLYALFYI